MDSSIAVNPLGISLVKRLRKSEYRNRLKALGLVAPLLAFIFVTFLFPIVQLLFTSVDNTVVPRTIPVTVGLLSQWDPQSQRLPDAEVYKAFATELASGTNLEISKMAAHLNYFESGARSLVVRTARAVDKSVYQESAEAVRDRLIDIDGKWGEPQPWALIRNYSGEHTAGFYLTSLDLRYAADGSIEAQTPEASLYRNVFGRTFMISALVTALCLLLGYPVAYLLASIPARIGNLLMIMVLLPFWTAILVRTTAWVVLLQSEGVINDALLALGIFDEPHQLIFNRFGVIVAMTHILLPYAILSLYSVMKGVSPVYVRAARSLGAGPVKSFFSVYLPQTMPGVSAAGMLVFILALGYYITPAMVGGGEDQMVSYFVAEHVNTTLNWGLASALGMLLLVSVVVLYGIYTRLVGGNGLKLG